MQTLLSRYLYAASIFFCLISNNAAAAAAANSQPVFQIQRVYLKQLNMEQPNSPAIFIATTAPTVEVHLETGAEKRATGIYEDWVSINVILKIDGKVALVLNAKQAGIFDIKNVKPQQIEALLAIGCPNIIYPYLRANVADAITRAGFPAINLAEINWEVFNEHKLQGKP